MKIPKITINDPLKETVVPTESPGEVVTVDSLKLEVSQLLQKVDDLNNKIQALSDGES
jgi:hypothetical protein